jgi:sterol desaturase/sphingolipid hydroxylase (fatty acid hydroxylase superfamily)
MNNEVSIRLGFFFAVLILVALWERVAPRRTLGYSKKVRWINNLGIVFLNSLAVRLLFPVVAVGMAFLAQERGWGILNRIELPYWMVAAFAVVWMDLAIYLQHVMFHALPALWRIHRMHHTDLDYDVTTGLRFHPIEIVLSMGIKLGVVALLGPPPAAVIVFEVLLNATSMFNHGNIRLPSVVDKVLRLILVTPDMHRVHHSIVRRETDSNFGFSIPWWDRLFGTYRSQPAMGHEGMTIGLEAFRDSKMLSLPWLLAIPFLRTSAPDSSSQKQD